MIKKTIVTMVGALLLGSMIFGKDIFSYASTACSNVSSAVKSEISPEFELDRIRNEIGKLMPEIRHHMTVVAEQSVDLRDLERDIARREQRLAEQKRAILALRNDLESGQNSFTYRHVSYTRGEVEADLESRFQAYRTGEEALERDRKILAAQRQTLLANQKKLDAMMSRKQELAVHVSQLEARLKTIQATEALHAIEVDDTRLSHVEDMIEELNHELDVRESLLQTEGNVLGRIPVEEENAVELDSDVVSKIDSHFGLEQDRIAESDTETDSSI